MDRAAVLPPHDGRAKRGGSACAILGGGACEAVGRRMHAAQVLHGLSDDANKRTAVRMGWPV